MTPGPKQGYKGITAAFGLTVLGAVGFAVVYALDADIRWQGGTLVVAFAGLAIGLGAWSKRHMPEGSFVEERPAMPSSRETRAALATTLDRHNAPVTAARWPRRMLVAGASTLGVALLFPARSLFRGPLPNRALSSTPWEAGSLLVRADGSAVRPTDLELDTMITVFPEGHTHAADTAVALLRLRPERLTMDSSRLAWTVDGIVAYSKLCTHAGCPVGQFIAATAQLMCPCHQSLFDVPGGAVPVAGPAARPLPQLPLDVDDAGYLVARGGFAEPVGPGYWRQA